MDEVEVEPGPGAGVGVGVGAGAAVTTSPVVTVFVLVVVFIEDAGDETRIAAPARFRAARTAAAPPPDLLVFLALEFFRMLMVLVVLFEIKFEVRGCLFYHRCSYLRDVKQ